jgi:hypothetical protein
MQEAQRRGRRTHCLLTKRELGPNDQKVKIITGPRTVPETGLDVESLSSDIGPFYADLPTFVDQVLNPLNCNGVPVEQLIEQLEDTRRSHGVALCFFIDELASQELTPKQVALITAKIHDQQLLHRILGGDERKKREIRISSKEGHA